MYEIQHDRKPIVLNSYYIKKEKFDMLCHEEGPGATGICHEEGKNEEKRKYFQKSSGSVCNRSAFFF